MEKLANIHAYLIFLALNLVVRAPLQKEARTEMSTSPCQMSLSQSEGKSNSSAVMRGKIPESSSSSLYLCDGKKGARAKCTIKL